MSEHEKDTRLRSWVRSPAGQRAPAELRRQVLDISTTEPATERRRRLWFLPGPKPTAGASNGGDRTQQTAPIPNTSGLLPAPTGGTRTMFSATKMVGTAAAIALFGVLMLAGPFGPPREVQPPAAPAFEPGEVTPFTGTMEVLGQDGAGTIERFDWGIDREGEQWTVRLETSDPRLSGLSSGYHNAYEVLEWVDDSLYRHFLRTYTARLFNEDGSWLETARGYQDPPVYETTSMGGFHYQSYLVGEGAYEGLFAISSCSNDVMSAKYDCEGVIFAGGLPEMPDRAPGQIPAAYADS